MRKRLPNGIIYFTRLKVFINERGRLMKKRAQGLLSAVLVLAMVLTMSNIPGIKASAAAAPKLSASKVSVETGKTKKVTIKNAPKGAKAVWASKNKKIAKVKKGKITGVKKGSTKVTCKLTYKKGGKKVTKKFSVKVTVKKAVLRLSAKNVTLEKGKSKKVTVQNAPKGAKKVWSSGNKKIATVKKGKITGVSAGKTNVVCKVTYKNKGKKVTKKLTVKVLVKNPASTATQKPAVTPAVPTPTPTPELKEVSNLTTEHKSANGITTRDNGVVRKELTASTLMKFMGQGINIGNSLEAILDPSMITDETTVYDYEKAWGNPLTTQECIDGIKKYGFNTVRIPVAWSNMISDDGNYTIDDSYFDRVEEVMNYCLNNEMYVIINIHYDSDWWGQFGDQDLTVRAEAWKRFESFWTQISERYKEYSDRVIFESANEELGDRLNDDWRNQSTDPKTGVLTEDEQYETVLQINQKFVDIVRKSGGNNTYRQLLIAGFNTDVRMTCDSRYIMPTDIPENGKEKMSISVHYYTPSTYCIAESDQGWGYRDSWGSEEDVEELHTLFDMMQKFTKEGYGVIIGEYGVQSPSKDGVPAYMKEVATYGAKSGYCPVLWDNNLWYNRTNNVFKYKDIAKVFIDVTGSDAEIPDGATTGIPKFNYIDETQATLKYTWEGKFVKNDGKNLTNYYEQTSCTEGMNVFSNAFQYYLYISADWESMEKPCIKVYVEDNDISKESSLQFGYVDYANGVVDSGDVWNDRLDLQASDGWIGKCVELKRDNLVKYDALYLSFGSGVTMTKFEIYDAGAQ